MKTLSVPLLCAALAATTLLADMPKYCPYGVCAHVTRWEMEAYRRARTMDCMALAGMGAVRSDFDARAVMRKDGTYDFSAYDAVVRDLAARNLTLLPIYYGPEAPRPPKDLEAYRAYIRAITQHFGARHFPVVEIWNEANLDIFFRDADPVAYARMLKVAYEAVKSVDPAIRVAFTGTSGVPLAWIRTVLENGAARSFDVMNVHPYSHPAPPEGMMDVQTEKLRELLAEFGRGDVPTWFTEIGWPTHSQEISHEHVLLAGLKVARPAQTAWKVVVADLQLDGPPPDQTVAEKLLDVLPPGSTARVCTQRETCRLLAAGDADAVFYPLDESFPAETIDAVNDFIAKGGVFVDMGGVPCYFGRRGTIAVEELQHGAAVARFPFGYRAYWSAARGVYPEETRVFATPAGLAAGVKQEPTGFKAERFLVPDRTEKEDEWIPLVAAKTTNGVDLVSAAVIRYRGSRKGAVVLSSLFTRGAGAASGTNSEENQARFTTRGLAIAFAEGVEAYFTYNLRAAEVDAFDSEHHFGLMHADFQPKPAYSAYVMFTRARPAGSVQSSAPWHDAAREFYFPQWTRPDGTKAGVVWSPVTSGTRNLRFVGGRPMFHNMYGRMIPVREVEPGVFRVPVSGAPIYFSCAELAR